MDGILTHQTAKASGTFGTNSLGFLTLFWLRISLRSSFYYTPGSACNNYAFTSLDVILCQEQRQISKLREKIIHFNPEFSKKSRLFDLHIPRDVGQLFPVLLHLILQNILHCSLPSSKFDPLFKIYLQ